MEKKTKNDEAWKMLFDKYDLLTTINSSGQVFISANQIREFREPRLMAKFDHQINLPDIFESNQLSILPTSRGDYVISHFKVYEHFQDVANEIIPCSIPKHLQSLDANGITSEAISINCALISGILADFLDEEELLPTVSGRMSSGSFDFKIENQKTQQLESVSVNNSQIEIDAAFEGISSLALIEAKRDLSEDFLVRQLYYPFRLWASKVTKTVRPVFLVFSNGIFNLYEYAFTDPNTYNSLQLVQHKKYSIEDTTIELTDIQQILDSTKTIVEPAIPFPQANNFSRVINLCELLFNSDMDSEQITENYAFDIRQTTYYTDACRYLGFVEKRTGLANITYTLTSRGNTLMALSHTQRQLEFVRCILEHEPFKKSLELYLDSGNVPSTNTVVAIMKSCKIYKVTSEATFKRRSSTILSWINWIIGLINN